MPASCKAPRLDLADSIKQAHEERMTDRGGPGDMDGGMGAMAAMAAEFGRGRGHRHGHGRGRRRRAAPGGDMAGAERGVPLPSSLQRCHAFTATALDAIAELQAENKNNNDEVLEVRGAAQSSAPLRISDLCPRRCCRALDLWKRSWVLG